MAWKDHESPAEMKQLVLERRFSEVRTLADALVADVRRSGRTVPAGTARQVLEVLRNGGVFDKLVEVAETIESFGQDEPSVVRQKAQGFIEAGRITQAIGLLSALRKSLEGRLAGFGPNPDAEAASERDDLDDERFEVVGLLGRAYKQLMVNAGPTAEEPRAADLGRALQHYQEAYQANTRRIWHGINAVALMTFQERIATNRPRALSPAARPIALRVIETISKREPGPWDHASLVEAYLALGDVDRAETALLAFLEHPRTDFFAVRGCLRQLREIWLLVEGSPPGDRFLPLITAKLGELGGAILKVSSTGTFRTNLEKVWGSTAYRPLSWLLQALERARGVARLGPSAYVGTGTGFLFDGALIGPGLGNQPLLLTNAHVCTDLPDVLGKWPYPLDDRQTTVTFFGGDGAPFTTRVKKVLSSSPPAALDYSLLLLEAGPPGVTPPPLAAEPLALPDDRLNIIGHPQGGDISVSLQDNHLRHREGVFIHYRSPTAPGSSGSPVYDQNWSLVALHHSASEAQQANEGILMSAILAELRARLA